MTAVAGNPGLFALGALNAESGWLQLFGLEDDIGFNIAGTFVGTITLRVSNQSANTKTYYSDLPTTYTTATGSRAVPRKAGRWLNFVMTAYTSGTAYVGITAPNVAGSGEPASIAPQMITGGDGTDQF